MTERREIDVVLRAAERAGGRVALRAGHRALTYGALADACGRVAASLGAAGLGRGDTVGVVMENAPEFVIAYYGAQWAGATLMPLNPRAGAVALRGLLERSRARALLVRGPEQATRLVGPEGLAGRVVFAFEPGGEAEGVRPALAAIPAPAPPGGGAHDISLVMFTTGTTGEAKGVLLRHANTLSAMHGILDFMRMHDGVIEVLPIPLYHSFGLARMRAVFWCLGTLVLANGFVFPSRLYDLVEEHRAQGFAAVPAGWEILLRGDRARMRHAFRSLEYVEIGSAPMSLDHKRALMDVLPKARICMHYGLTEASRSTFMDFHADADDLETIGRPLRDVEVTVRDERGEPVAEGHDGELCVKGPTVFAGYLGDARATDEALRGGWLRTGDIGRRGPDGRFHLAGRLKELINLGGSKVSPLEIERVLNACPGVLESAVVGVPTPRAVTGEEIRAFVVPRPGSPLCAADVLGFAASRLEPLRRPVVVSIVSALPKTESGKLRRRELSHDLASQA